jgi:Ribbon-helix-helix protein, copG family
MSDIGSLNKSRSVRFSERADRRLQAKAARAGKTVSDVVRQMVEAELEAEEQTAGQWVLFIAHRKPRPQPLAPERLAFRRAYKKRHG